VVLENEPSENTSCYQEVNPLSGSAGAMSCDLPLGSTAVGTIGSYALFLAPGSDVIWVLYVKTGSLIGSVSLPLTAGSPMDLAVNPDAEYAYVSQPSTHKVVTIDISSTSPYFQVLGTYTGSSSFNPGPMTVAYSCTTAYVSDGSNIDVVGLSSGDFNSSGAQVALGATAGVSIISTTDATLYVQMPGSDNVDVVTLSDDAVSDITAPISAGPLALNRDGGALGLGSANSSTLDLLSTVNGSVENSVSLDGTPVAVINADYLLLRLEAFVPLEGTNKVAMVDASNEVVDADVSTGTGSDPVAVAVSPDGNYAYVADEGNNTVAVLQNDNMDTSSNVDVASVALPSGSEPDAIAVDPAGDRVLVADMGTGELSVIDSNPNDSGYLSVLYTVYLDGSGTSSSTMQPNAIAISPDGDYAYVSDGGSSEVTVLSLTSPGTYGFSHNSTGLGFAGEPQDIAISPNDQLAYVTDATSSGNGYLRSYHIDPHNGIFYNGHPITVGNAPGAVALLPEGQTAYVTNSGSGTVSVINTSSDTVTNSLSDSGGPVGVGVTPDGATVLAADSTGGSVSFWNVVGGASIATVSLGSGADPASVAVSEMFNSPSGGELTGTEDDANPAVAASSGVDTVDGVSTATGGYVLDLDDLSTPDVGLGLDLSQTYDSERSALNGPLGYGWSFSYAMSFGQNAWNDGTVGCDITITQENGTPVVFLPPTTGNDPCPTSGYVTPAWEQASLKLVSNCYSGDACWDLTRDGTDQYLFDESTGKLVFEKDPNGNTLTLGYSSGKLASVTGQSGQSSLSFTWTGSDITGVTDSAGRTATFSYSSGYLTDLTLSASSTGDATSHHWHFSYNSADMLSDWWNPDNEANYAGNTAEATQITYDSSAQVTQVVDPDWVTNCTGGSSGADCAPTTSFSYPAFDTSSDTGSVLVSDPNQNYDISSSVYGGDGDVTLDRYVDGVLVEQVKGYGYELSSTSPYTNYPRTTAMTHVIPDPFTWLASESFDGNGNETQTTYDASGNAIKTVDPIGRTTTYLYNPFNEVILKTDPMGYVTSYAYNVHGNELTR
jgi:YVTN family beta-propeller protein/YD repeat-containing protein